MQHDIPQSNTYTQHHDMGQTHTSARATGTRDNEIDGQQEERCHLKAVEVRRHRTSRGVRDGRPSGGGSIVVVRGGATDDAQCRSPGIGDGSAQSNEQQSWGTVLQILILALLLSGLYMTSPDHLKGCNPGNRTDQCATFSFSEDLSSTHHKTTASWALHVLDQGMGWSVGGGAMGTVMEMRDAHLTACTTKLVDSHPLTTWEQARLQVQACYEAARCRMGKHRDTDGGFKEANGQIPSGSWGVQQTERGMGHGSTGDQQVEEPADSDDEGTIKSETCGVGSGYVTTDLEAPLKRQRLGEVTGVTPQEEVRGEAGSEPRANRREVLTIFRRQIPASLDVAEVIRLIGTPLTMLVGTMKHMAKRAVPVKAWATEIEAIATPTITDVLEASWKWDGQSEQPQWEPDSDRFTQLFPTYQP